MKKIITILFAGALMVSFVACGGSKENAESQQDATEEAAAESVAEVVDVEKALKDFEAYVESFVEVMKKMKSGDVSVAGEYSKLSRQKQQYDADMARYSADFDDAQKERLRESGKKLAEAIKSLSEKK